MTNTSARRHFGFENLAERPSRCIDEAESIRRSIDSLSRVQEKAVVQSVGLTSCDDSCGTSSEDEHEPCDDPIEHSENEEDPMTGTFAVTHEEFLVLLQESMV